MRVLRQVKNHAIVLIEYDTHMLLDNFVIKEMVNFHTCVPNRQVNFYSAVIERQHLRRGVHPGTHIVVMPKPYFDVDHAIFIFVG